MSWPASLRARLALIFGVAVSLTMLFFGAAVVVALYADQVGDAHAANPACESDTEDDIEHVLVAMGLVAPFAVFGAIALGYGLAGRALRPLKEASDRARVAAQSTSLDLQLPLSGRGDEWDELATTLNRLLQDSRASLERIRRFTSDAAHELRTPLTTLVGEAELALRRERSGAQLNQAMGVILEEGRRLTGLVERLLVLARADAGALAPVGTVVDLSDLVRHAISRLAPGPEGEPPVTLVEAERVLVQGDATLLEQLFTNLLDNAVRHGKSPVRVALGSREGRARVEVSDSGPGIASGLVPVLFDRFTRGDAARTTRGHGLGLSIARTLAEAHGGTLTYEGLEGRGATFVLELPRT